MTPQERAAAEQAIGTAQSRTQRAMEQRGLGNLAAAVSQIRTTEAMNQLEAQNQAIKRQSLGQYASLAGQMQSIQNQNIQSFNQMLYAQQQALGQAAQAGFKNLAGTGATIAEAIEGKEAIDDATVKDPVTTGQMGVTDTTAMPSVTSDSLLPTQDIGEAPAIPSGAGYPGITSTSVLGPDGLPMQAPTQTSFQLPTETLGAPQIPLGAGGFGTSPLEGYAGFDAGAAFGEYMTAPSDNYFTTE
jgi:hypothetical protein